jgi:hypothetical protein
MPEARQRLTAVINLHKFLLGIVTLQNLGVSVAVSPKPRLDRVRNRITGPKIIGPKNPR